MSIKINKIELEKALKKNEYTKSELSTILGISPTTFSRKMQTGFSPAEAFFISQILGLPRSASALYPPKTH
jgi:hypothetical protein